MSVSGSATHPNRPAPPMAMCPQCREVLVATFERPKKEFLCLGCGEWWEFLQPLAAPATPERLARAEELKAMFRAGIRKIDPDCTGAVNSSGLFAHDGDSCPIHKPDRAADASMYGTEGGVEAWEG